MSIACSGRQRWLMFHFVGWRRIAGQRHLGLHLLEALLDQRMRRLRRPVMRQVATERAGRVGRHPVAVATEQLPDRLLQRLALDVPERDVDGRMRQREDAARPAGIAGAIAQLAHDLLDPQRILADGELGQFLDGDLKAAGHLATIEGDADAFDAVVGAQAQRHDGPEAPGIVQRVRERVGFRNVQGRHFVADDLHGASIQWCGRELGKFYHEARAAAKTADHFPRDVGVMQQRRSAGEHGKRGLAVAGLQLQERGAGIPDVLFGPALGRHLEGKRRRVLRAADERQRFRQAPHGGTIDLHLFHSGILPGLGFRCRRTRLTRGAPAGHRSTGHQLDADPVGCGNITQQAAVGPVLERDREGRALRLQLVAESAQVAGVEEAEMVRAPFIMA